MQEVPDLPETLEALCLQPDALGIALEDGFVDQETDLLDLGYLQPLCAGSGVRWGREENRGGEGAGS